MTESAGPGRSGDASGRDESGSSSFGDSFAYGMPQRHTFDPAHAMAARLLLMVPLIIGVLLAEGIFAARGTSADSISLPSAVIAFLLLWLGVAWALRSWVAILLTFVPAVITTLGVAMVGDVEPVGGAALLVIGATMMLAIVWSRVTAPHRRWTPGWMAPNGDGDSDGDGDGRAGNGSDANDVAGDGAASQGTSRGEGPRGGAAIGAVHRGEPTNRGAGTDGGAAVSADDDDPRRLDPAWDTSGTDRRARDAFVAELCRRGGAAGPTVASLEDFFTGNGDPRSIAPGLRGTVPLNDFRIILHRLRSRPDVSEVSIQLEPLEAGEYPAGEWPVAGSVRVVGSIPIDTLDDLIAPLRAEQVVGPLPLVELGVHAPVADDSSEFAIWWG